MRMAGTARDLMQTRIVTVTPSQPLPELLAVLLRHRIHGAPVVEDGRLVGIISRSDVVRQLKLEEERIADSAFYFEPFDADEHRTQDQARALEAVASRVAKLRVRDVMIRDLITIDLDAKVEAIARVMQERRVHRILVTEGEQLRGIISSLDLVGLLADGRAAMVGG
jgi:CBS domain-containing protein